MSNKVYDALKFVAQILLPALATLYFALAQIWNLPYGEQIVGTITAIDAFLLIRKLMKNYGSLFGKTSKKSKKKH